MPGIVFISTSYKQITRQLEKVGVEAKASRGSTGCPVTHTEGPESRSDFTAQFLEPSGIHKGIMYSSTWFVMTMWCSILRLLLHNV
jgi:hypothetical protein